MSDSHSSERDDIAAIAAALGCGMEAAQALRADSHIRSEPSPVVLAHQGDGACGDWLILDGAVRSEILSSDGRLTILATHPSGDMVGAFGRGNTALSATLITHGPTRLLTIHAATINRLGKEDGAFAVAVAHSYARQAGAMLDRLANRISLTAAGRIYTRLLELADTDRLISPAPLVAALAVHAQTTRETASRAISVIERRGIIERNEGGWTIQSPRMLEDMIV